MPRQNVNIQCLARVSKKSVKKECLTRVSSKSVLYKCQDRVSSKSVLQKCQERVSSKSVLQECRVRVSNCEKLNAWLHDPYTRMTHTNRDVQLSVQLPCKMHVPGPVVQNSLRCSVSFRMVAELKRSWD